VPSNGHGFLESSGRSRRICVNATRIWRSSVGRRCPAVPQTDTNERRPIGINPVPQAVRDLIKEDVLKSFPINATRSRHAFRLAYTGRKVLSEMNR
jgi:hypothetical protein